MFVLLVLWHSSVLQAIQLLESSKTDARKVFREFESEFSRHYKGREERERYRVFKKRYNEVKEHNHLHKPDYFKEINKFSDLKHEELSEYLGMGNMTELITDLQYIKEEDEEINMSKRQTPPAEVDHRTAGLVTPVKNQHACGSCWTFSAVGAFEGAYKQATGYLKSFSEQELLDCYYGDSYDSCNGGYHYKPYYYIKYYKRLATYNDYPYVATDRPCDKNKLPRNGMKNVRFEGFKVVSSDSGSVERALSQHLLAVAVHASTMFPYRSGVFTGCPPSWKSAKIDHAMVMTGYSQSYWTLKNSWGEDWGENGYIRVSRDPSQSMCKITQAPVYPEVTYVAMGERDSDDIYAEKDDDDVALTGKASQSTTADHVGKASCAVDGKTDGDYTHGSCSKTMPDYISWWRVELTKTRTINRVVVSLRSDNYTLLAELDGATLHVGNRGDYTDTQCGDDIDTSTHQDYQITKKCHNLVGKFVTVDFYHPRRPLMSLVLCEVQIYAHDDDGDCKAGNVKCKDGLCKPPSFC